MRRSTQDLVLSLEFPVSDSLGLFFFIYIVYIYIIYNILQYPQMGSVCRTLSPMSWGLGLIT